MFKLNYRNFNSVFSYDIGELYWQFVSKTFASIQVFSHNSLSVKLGRIAVLSRETGMLLENNSIFQKNAARAENRCESISWTNILCNNLKQDD